MLMISQINIKGNDVTIFRDTHGKWFVQVNSVMTQKRLNAAEIVRWLSNASHTLAPKFDNEQLINEMKIIARNDGLVPAIKFVRSQRGDYGFKEAKDFVEKYR